MGTLERNDAERVELSCWGSAALAGDGSRESHLRGHPAREVYWRVHESAWHLVVCRVSILYSVVKVAVMLLLA